MSQKGKMCSVLHPSLTIINKLIHADCATMGKIHKWEKKSTGNRETVSDAAIG
jgi:hypothetical protein